VQDDVRSVDSERFGIFDVVLCLGILYHLPKSDVVPFLRNVSGVSRRLMILETQISMKASERVDGPWGGYAGKAFGENPRYEGAALNSQPSFWLTRSSLLNLLADVGFTSISEPLTPLVLFTAKIIDHSTLLAVKGAAMEVISSPEIGRMALETWRWPEGLRRSVTPNQNRWKGVRDRILQMSGRGIQQKLRRKNPPD